MLIAHGFSIKMVEIINAGLATATVERVIAGSKTMEIARVRITEEGRDRSAMGLGSDRHGRSDSEGAATFGNRPRSGCEGVR